MTILFDVMLRMARELDEVYEGTATGGSATTLVDTSNMEPNDYWNNGVLFFKSGNRINTTTTITDWNSSSQTFTFATGLACASTNTYLAIREKWGRSAMLRAINVALKKQDLISNDETTVVVADQLAYTLPSGVRDVIGIWIGNDTDGWEPHHEWREESDELRFYANEPSDTTQYIRIRYRSKHADMSADSGTIDDAINLDRLNADALAEAHRWRYYLVGDQEPREAELAWWYDEQSKKHQWVQAPNVRTPHFTGW